MAQTDQRDNQEASQAIIVQSNGLYSLEKAMDPVHQWELTKNTMKGGIQSGDQNDKTSLH